MRCSQCGYSWHRLPFPPPPHIRRSHSISFTRARCSIPHRKIREKTHDIDSPHCAPCALQRSEYDNTRGRRQPTLAYSCRVVSKTTTAPMGAGSPLWLTHAGWLKKTPTAPMGAGSPLRLTHAGWLRQGRPPPGGPRSMLPQGSQSRHSHRTNCPGGSDAHWVGAPHYPGLRTWVTGTSRTHRHCSDWLPILLNLFRCNMHWTIRT